MGKMMLGTYRTGIVNDFSVVSKATITIIKYDPMGKITSFIPIEVLPVQINPDKFEYTSKTDITRIKGTQGDQVNTVIPSTEKSTSIDLKYDIYDEYMIGTADGHVPKPMSLFDEKLTSLPKLVKYASCYERPNNGTPFYYAYFVWGDIEYFGILSGVSCEYKAFSRWGEPLKCDAKVYLELEAKPTGMDFTVVDDMVTSYTKASKTANMVALGATQALR